MNVEARRAVEALPNRYRDNALGCEAVKLLPGEYFATDRDVVLVTVLGSCVAACIRDRATGIGGMNHFMLPRDDAYEPVSRSARYGAYAMELLINQLLRMGARRATLEAKIFGGGAVIPGLTALNVGQSNVEFVKEYLGNERIEVVGQDLNGSEPRKVYYFPRSGRVLVRKLHRVHNATLFDRETEYRSRLQQSSVAGEVELFI